MKTTIKIAVLLCLACVLTCVPLLAVGPIDGEVSTVWWANQFDAQGQSGSASSDAGELGLKAELWLHERYGLRASQYGSSPDDVSSDGADYTSLDVMWRALAPTDNQYVAVGLGWQQMKIDGFGGDTSGVRVSVDGRFDIPGPVYAYGHGSYLPALEESSSSSFGSEEFEDITGFEYEFGVAWTATPIINVHAGFRTNSINFSQAIPAPASVVPPVQPVIERNQGGARSGVASSSTPECSGCIQAAAVGSTSGNAESSGFYVGIGFTF